MKHMIGILIGAAAVAGIVAFKRHRYRRWAMGGTPGCHGGYHRWHHHHHGCHDEWHGGGGRFARWAGGGMLYGVLAELDCTPAQERMIREEVRGVMEKLRELREEKDASRDDLASAIEGATLDRKALDGMFARHDQRLVAVRGEVAAALGRIHASLDDKQRARLAELVRGGWRARRGGPYR